ncbi:MAG: hypothetical protein RL375_4193 [Pseudomonadota bacterium]|jgi:hypothetical protein
MSLVMQGTWNVSVKSKNASFPQRFRIAGAATGNGTFVGATSTPPVLVTGASWTITIEAQAGKDWHASAMRYKTPVAMGASLQLDIESDDGGGGGDQDFDDLVLTCSMTSSAADFLVYGHATAYSGLCLFNPCWRSHLVIDSAQQLHAALKNPAIRSALEKLYPEVVRRPGPGNPPDPGPLATFTPLMLPTPRSPALPTRVMQVTQTRAAETTRQFVAARSPVTSLLDTTLTTRLGRLLDGYQRVPLRCTTTTLGHYALRFQEYDRTSDELSGGAYTGTGDRETLGQTATDSFGNYVFRFSRGIGDIVGEALGDVAIGEDATVQALPDVIAQVLGAGAIPAAETPCHFNVGPLTRIDICVPASSIVLPTTCVDHRLLTFIGKISLTSSLNSLDATGRISAASTAGNAPTIQCGVWWGNLDLWGCLGNPIMASYTVRTRPLGGGPGDWLFHAADERREVGGGLSKKIGPFFDLPLAVPFDTSGAKVPAPRYLNAELDPTIVQPGAHLKATLGASTFAPGSYEVRIDTFNAAGEFLTGEQIVLYVDNRWPDVAISDITLAGVPVNISGNGCTLQALGPADLSGDLVVRYKVDHQSGAILNYALGVSRCNEGVAFPTVHAGGGDPSFTWTHDSSVDCDAPPNARRGTVEDPDNDGSGFVSAVLSPAAPWLGASELFTILRVGVGYQWRATNGYSNASAVSYGPLVWGIQK